MCGIAGVLYADPSRPAEPAVLKKLGDAIAHRGPDAEGYWREPGIGLVHRRLSIIDLAGGNQPMGNEDGSVQVVFNGEIYNYQPLRAELAARGHCFASQSDTEVLVHLYEELGDRFVERLRGMFALALWDRRARRLVLARDRIGLKPLFIYRDPEKLLFGSELKAILAHPDVDRTVDPRGLEDYLAWGLIPGGRSIFRRAEKLPAAHVLSIASADLAARPRRYWNLDMATQERPLDEWLSAIDAKLTETVAAHRIADVPVGAFLSGGLDSSVIVSTLARQHNDRLQTFSIGFHEDAYNELPYAREVARRFATDHVEELVTPDAAGSLDQLVHAYDEPFADPSAIPTLYVSRLARRRVKVVLSGDGGDEAFGGYSRYAHDLAEGRWRRRLPGWLRTILIARLARAWPKADWLPRPLRAKTALTNLSLDAAEAYANTLTLCRLPLRRMLLASDLRAQLDGYSPATLVCEAYRRAPPADDLAGMIATDVAILLPDGFLTKVDRASMAYGLEVRPPLVDHELLELAAQVPSRWKIQGRETKWLLKRLFDERLPRDVVWRAKHGFDLPVDEWLRGPLREMFEAAVLAASSRVVEFLDQAAIRRLYRQHLAGVGRHGRVLWATLIFARWAERYLGSAQREPAKTLAVLPG